MSIAMYLQVQELERLVAEHEERLAEAERALRTLPPRASKPAAEAVAFLTKALAAGPRQAIELLRLADDRGISERTLRRAKSALGVASVRRRRGSLGRAESWWSISNKAGHRWPEVNS